MSEERNTRVLGLADPTACAAYSKSAKDRFTTEAFGAKIRQCPPRKRKLILTASPET